MVNSSYVVLSRKYRPQTFGELVGQDNLVKTLRNAIGKDRMHHAFVLSGIRGVGKTTAARIIAKSLNCVGRGLDGAEISDPCLRCEHCISISAGNSHDVVEFDAASHTGVNDIREIMDNVNYAPISSRYKIYIIDEVHMLSNSAFNALLKTLEEPPEYVKFIFATTEIRKVPTTVLSRCIRFDLVRVSHAALRDNLVDISRKEGYTLDETAASLLAYAAEGSVRDSLSLLDKVISYNNFDKTIGENVVLEVLGLGGGKYIYDLYGLLLRSELKMSLQKFDEIYPSIGSADNFIRDSLELTHELLMSKSGAMPKNISSFQRQWLENNIGQTSVAGLLRLWQFLVAASFEINSVSNHKNFIEILLIRICYGINIPEINDIIKKLQNNKNTLESPQAKLVDKVLNTFSGSKIL
ncbi:MAG: DNA polymerase III subunit gamma/tau [Rickettsiales bacterium]|jgi:DNA polymerase-3 subunit gamma/tau|nr:DNA polymerase III subunit gamma/tau [Rickettsiales bacterium]